jgi:hypothetical protein
LIAFHSGLPVGRSYLLPKQRWDTAEWFDLFKAQLSGLPPSDDILPIKSGKIHGNSIKRRSGGSAVGGIMMNKSVRSLSDSDRRLLRSLLGRYALRYHLAGSEKDELVEETYLELHARPEVFFEMAVEHAVAETMHRVFVATANKPT